MFDATDRQSNAILLRNGIASVLSEIPAAPYDKTAWLAIGSKQVKLVFDIDPNQQIEADLSQVMRERLASNNMFLAIEIPAQSATPESLTELIFQVIQVGPNEAKLKQVASGCEVSVESNEKGPSLVTLTFAKSGETRVEDKSESASKAGRQIGLENIGAVRQAVQSARFTQKEKVVVQTSDILSGINDARRELQFVRLSEALKAVDRLSSTFDQRISQWERLATGKEQSIKRSPGSMSLGEITRMRTEHTRVRRDYRLAQTKFRRLRSELGQLEMAAQRGAAAQEDANGIQRTQE